MMKTLAMWPTPFRRPAILGGGFNEFFLPLLGDWERSEMPERAAPTGYVPPIASYVDGNTIHINADLPGVEPSEVELTVKENQLILTGTRKAALEQHNGNRYQQEVRYGSFARTFTLPDGVTAEGLQARYHNGVLEITVSMPAAQLSKKVPVQIAGEEPRAVAA
jgi:HSP20 family protein